MLAAEMGKGESPSSPPNSWRCKRFSGFAVAWLLIASGSSIKSAVFSGSPALSLRKTLAICGELWRTNATLSVAEGACDY